MTFTEAAMLSALRHSAFMVMSGFIAQSVRTSDYVIAEALDAKKYAFPSVCC